MDGDNSKRRKKRGRKAAVWSNFTHLRDEHGKETGMVECNRCHKHLAGTNGTSSPMKHVEACSRQEAAPEAVGAVGQSQPPRPPCAPSRPPCAPSRPGGSSDCRQPEPGLEEVMKHLARMIALRGHDPSVLEDDCFRSFVRSLNSGFEVPSRVAIEELCDGIFDEARRDSFSKLRRAPGRLSFAVGKVKTIEAGEVIYIACHFIHDQWNLHKVVMDAVVAEGHHEYLDDAILGLNLVSDDAGHDVMHVISDCGYNLALVAYDIGDDDDDIYTRLKGYIAELNSGADLISSTTITYVDNVLHSIARYLLQDPIVSRTDVVFENMMSLHLTRQERLRLLSELGLDYKWAVDEPWCAFYFSLEVLRKRFIETALADDGGLIEELLFKVWGQVYHGIQRISASTCPTSNLCLAEFLKLREILHSELARFSGDDQDVQERTGYFYDAKTVDVLGEASDTLDKAIQDSYLVWSVPLALDPRYKLSYIEFSFKRAFGSESAAECVSTVTIEINKLYADYIKEYGTITTADHSDGANAMIATTSDDPWDQAWYDHRHSQDTVIAAQVNSSYPETQTDKDRYLQDPLAPATKDFDILNWWKENSQKYPTVARMARDALAMPTCSKLSSDQLAQVKSILRGYSKKPYTPIWDRIVDV